MCLSRSSDIDVATKKAIEDNIEQIVKELGRLGYADNCAGMGGSVKTSDQISKADFENVVAVNITGVWQRQCAQIRQTFEQEKLTVTLQLVAPMYGFVTPHLNIPATAYARGNQPDQIRRSCTRA
jgi:NADP-dependent 3-hydroxy acid dehydrogenase YdfG